MPYTEIATLAELLASLAALLTLLVLVFQIRGARQELSGRVTREIKRHNNEAFHQLTQDPEMVKLHLKAQSDFEHLTDEENIRWQLWMFTWINQTEDAWLARRSGVRNLDWVENYVFGIALVLRSKGGRSYWPIARSFFDEDFIDEVESVVDRDTTTFADLLLGS